MGKDSGYSDSKADCLGSKIRSLNLTIKEIESKNEIMEQALKLLRQNLKWDAGNFEIINESLKKIEGPKF